MDLLVEHLKMHLLAVELRGDLAEVQGRTGQSIEAGHDQGVAFPHIFQTGAESRSLVRRAAVLLLEDLLAPGQLGQLDLEALPHGTDPRIADPRHGSLLTSHCV